MRWGLSQTITVATSGALSQVVTSGFNQGAGFNASQLIRVATDAQGIKVILGGDGAGTMNAVVTTAKLIAVTVSNAGTTYAVGDTMTIGGGSCSATAQLTVTASTTGALGTGSVTISNRGVYQSNPTGTLSTGTTSGTGSGATFLATWGNNVVVVPASSVGLFSLGPKDGIALAQLNTAGTVTVSEALA